MFLKGFDLALRRTGFPDYESFQTANGLYPSGRADASTVSALMPYLLGYRIVQVQPGSTLYTIAQRNGTTVQAIETANPGLDAANLPVGHQIVVPLGFSVVPTGVPFTSNLLQFCIQGLLARYPFLRVETIAYTTYGRPVPSLQIGEGEYHVLYNASHHANEWITTPLLMKFLEEYCDAIALGTTLRGVNAGTLFSQTQLTLVPMVNPDGVDLVTGEIEPATSEYRTAQEIAADYPTIPFPDGWKANLNGVDLNLNYPAGWEQAREIKFAQGYNRPAPRDYVGAAPLDQQESAALANLTRRVLPRLTLSYHTQGRVIYWKYLDFDPPGALEKGEALAEVSGYTLETTPYASGFAGYKDWFIQEWNLPGYTVEAGLGQNPLPLSQFDILYENNLGILVEGLRK